jgi:hypothetical protein
MNKAINNVIAAFALWVWCAAGASAAVASPLVALGVIASDVPEQEMTQPTEIMKSKGTIYGWVALFPYHEPGTTRTVTVRETIDVPEAPVAWVVPGHSSISNSGTHVEMVTTETITARGLIVRPHTFLPGDPLGPWRIRVEIEGKEVGDFRFNVVTPPPPAKKNEII